MSQTAIGYLSGQDGAILPAQDFSLGPAWSKIISWCFTPYNKSFIDQALLTLAWSINMQEKNLANIKPS